MVRATDAAITWKGWTTLFSVISLVSVLNVWIELKSVNLSELSQESERLNGAVAQLSSQGYPERLAGVLTLAEIRDQNSAKAADIDHILTAFIDGRMGELTSCSSPSDDILSAVRVRYRDQVSDIRCGDIDAVNDARVIFDFSLRGRPTLHDLSWSDVQDFSQLDLSNLYRSDATFDSALSTMRMIWRANGYVVKGKNMPVRFALAPGSGIRAFPSSS